MYYMSKRFATVSLLAILVAAPFTSAQQQPPPPPARAPGSSLAAPTNPPPPTASTTPATPPARAPTATTTTTATPPAAATPPARAPTAATPPTQAATPPQQAAAANAARAPTVAPTTAAGARPATAPTPAQTAVNPIAPAARSPTSGPTTSAAAALTPGSRIAPAPGPSGSGTVNASAVVTSPGALNSAQQTQLCQTVVGALVGQFPSVSQCTVSSQTAAPQSSFATSGRKLSQATVTLTLGLSLSSATANQLPGIQSILNRLVLNIGGTRTTLVIVNINIIQVNLVPTTAPLPANTPALPSSTTITAATSPATAPAPAATVVTAVPPNATGNTTQNVSAQNAKPPPAPANGTNTVTTITNTTHTTTTTTIAYFVVTTQITIIQQYYFTVLIGQTTGVFTIIVFNLPGNVANNLPLVVTGGAVTGQTATIQVTGATVTTITSTTIATQVTTSTSTSTTTTTTTTPGTPTTPTTPTTPANTRNVCSVPNNPYGLIQNTANEGTLIKGAFLVSSWNDVTGNNPGQGNIIYQCLPDGTATKWATVTVTGACTRDGAGVGLTMALSRCGSVIIVGSLPIPVGGTAKPGCLIALDTSGKVINEVTSPGINGPWGSVCTSSGSQITLALSSVLGGLAPATTAAASGGRRLLAPAPSPSASVTGGFVVRWTFATPTQGSTWTLGAPTFLVQGIMTNGSAGVAGGAVGPGGPAVDDQGTIYLPDLLGNRLLKVPNGFTTSTPTSSVLTTSVALNGPNSLYFGQGQLVGANTGAGTLFTVTLDSGRNGGPTTLTQVDPQNAAGVLFNVIYSVDNSAGAPIGSTWFQHDGTNTLNTIVGSGAPAPAPGASTAILAQGPSRGVSPTSG